jgi:hypothetical protein
VYQDFQPDGGCCGSSSSAAAPVMTKQAGYVLKRPHVCLFEVIFLEIHSGTAHCKLARYLHGYLHGFSIRPGYKSHRLGVEEYIPKFEPSVTRRSSNRDFNNRRMILRALF